MAVVGNVRSRRWLVAAVAVVGLIGTGSMTSDEYHFHHFGQVDVEAAPGLVGAVAVGSDGASLLRVRVLVDESFREAYGPDWAQAAWRTVHGANALVQGVDLRLAITEIENSDNSTADLADLGAMAAAGRNRGTPVVVALTARDDGWPVDGWAIPGAVAVARITERNWNERSGLIAHELGHVLGAHHHEPGHTCSEGRSCVMAAEGYSGADRWCDEHEAVVAAVLAQILPEVHGSDVGALKLPVPAADAANDAS